MTSAFVSSSNFPGSPDLGADLESVGIRVLGSAAPDTLVFDVIRNAPDMVVCYENHPDDALFSCTSALSNTAPRPVVVFTTDSDVAKIERATRSGIHAYVINGYGFQRLRSVIHVAQARFRYDQMLREELNNISSRFDERKLVDRAKGILMKARQISEDEAFGVLRSVSMHCKLRLGKVSQQVIDAARYAEAVNRSGQLRMLSQRLVKLYGLMCLGTASEEIAGLFNDSMERTDKNLAILSKSLSKPTFGDLIDSLSEPWSQLKAALRFPPDRESLLKIDALAEKLLVKSEQLTSTLETAGFATTLHVINVAGRQRMLSQRIAKQALLGLAQTGQVTEAARGTAQKAKDEFVAAMDYLTKIPLSTPEIRKDLESATLIWATFSNALQRGSGKNWRLEIADSSELLLAHFDRLTDHYERSMQMLIG